MSKEPESASEARRPDGVIDSEVLSMILGISEDELIGQFANTIGFDPAQMPQELQHRLAVLVELIDRVSPWTGGTREAYEWYCRQPLPAFGGQTAMDLVNEGRESAVRAYVERINSGGYA
jgi:hypothetical protein